MAAALLIIGMPSSPRGGAPGGTMTLDGELQDSKKEDDGDGLITRDQ